MYIKCFGSNTAPSAPSDHSAMDQALVDDQMTMGWCQFLQGKLTKDCITVLNKERRGEGKNDADRIMVKVIKVITPFTFNLWYSRCSQVFGGTQIHCVRKKWEHLLAQEKDLIKDQSVLTQNGKDHIGGAPEDSTILCDMLVWIRITRTLYQHVKKKQKGHSTHRITVYFLRLPDG